jgi:hypothetical protein
MRLLQDPIIAAFIGLVVLFLGFSLGRMLPTHTTRRKIRDKAIADMQNEICRWYTGVWKCVEVVDNHLGPFGMPLRVVVLESAKERIRVRSNEIKLGTAVTLKPVDYSIKREGIWVSALDKLMYPETTSGANYGLC